MACSKLEARGHLLHKTGTPPKHSSRECSTLNWFTNFLLSSIQNSIKNIQTNQLRILEPSVKNSIFCKEFKRHFVNINVPTLLIYRQVYLLACRHLRCPEVFTSEIEKDDSIDPFDKSNPFNRVRLVSGYYQPWIGFTLKDCPMDNVHSTGWLLKALSVHKVERTCWIW